MLSVSQMIESFNRFTDHAVNELVFNATVNQRKFQIFNINFPTHSDFLIQVQIISFYPSKS